MKFEVYASHAVKGLTLNLIFSGLNFTCPVSQGANTPGGYLTDAYYSIQ
jgi:hypothetical protein